MVVDQQCGESNRKVKINGYVAVPNEQGSSMDPSERPWVCVVRSVGLAWPGLGIYNSGWSALNA